MSDHYYSIRTASGRLVCLATPHPNVIDLGDISHALAQINRYNGHSSRPYAVSGHCYGVAQLLRLRTGSPTTALVGVLHDAAETYLQDLSSPLRRLPIMKGYNELMARWEKAVYERFSLAEFAADPSVYKEVKRADKDMGRLEMSRLMGVATPSDDPIPDDVIQIGLPTIDAGGYREYVESLLVAAMYEPTSAGQGVAS